MDVPSQWVHYSKEVLSWPCGKRLPTEHLISQRWTGSTSLRQFTEEFESPQVLDTNEWGIGVPICELFGGMFVYNSGGENSRNKTVKNPTKTRNITEYLLVYEISVNSGRLVTRR